MDHVGLSATSTGPRVLVYGWYGHGNTGDESYRISFPALWPQLQLIFTDNLENVNQEDYDILLIGGGNILDHNFLGATRRFVETGWNKPIYAFSVGSTDRQITLADLELLYRVWARDYGTVKRLQALGYNRVTYCPDAAFVFVPDRERGQSLWRSLYSGSELYERKVIVTINGHLLGMQNGLAREAVHFLATTYDLAQIVDDTNASFMFLPFSCRLPWDDRIANGCVATKCKWSSRLVMVHDRLSVQSTVDLISAADLIISMRYHSTVFALRSCTPFIDIYHHDKNKNFLHTIGYSDWGVDYWEFRASKVRELITRHIEGGSGVRARLDQTQAQMTQQLLGHASNVRFSQRSQHSHGDQQNPP